MKILQWHLCLGQSYVYMFVCKISINEESLIKGKDKVFPLQARCGPEGG